MAQITVDQIPWDDLKSWGITRSAVEQNKENIERLLSGRFTSPLQFYRSEGGMHIEGVAALRCYAGRDGMRLEMQGIAPKITENSKLYVFGTELSKEQVRNLLDTGHAGSLVESRDGSRKYLVSLNRETNRLVTYPSEGMTGPKDGMIAGVRLTPEQMEKYRAGEAVFLRGLTRSDGTRFDACAQFSAWTRRNDFTHPEWLRKSRGAEKKALEKIAEAPAEEKTEKKGRGRRA